MVAKKENRRLKPVKNVQKSRSTLFATMWRYTRLTLLTTLIVSFVSVAGYYATRTAQSLLQSPIETIVVKGNFQYIDKQVVETLMQDVINKSFVGENITQVQEKLQAYPWIDQVSLSRQWPDRLQVAITEQIPIARWGNKGFVNNRGELIMTPDVEKLSAFAELDGNADEAGKMMRQYSLIAEQLRPYGYMVTSLQKNQRGVWKVQLNNGWEIILGKHEVLRKIYRLTALLRQKEIPNINNIEVIDARYSNGFAIRWSENQDEHQEETIAAINIRGSL